MLKLVNETTMPLYYRIASLVTCDESLAEGTLAPNQITAYNFTYEPQANQPMAFARVHTYTPETPRTMLEVIDVPADTTITFSTEIATGFLA